MNLDTQYITYQTLHNSALLLVDIRSYSLKMQREARHEDRDTQLASSQSALILFILNFCSSVTVYSHIDTYIILLCVSALSRQYVRNNLQCQYSPSSLSETRSLFLTASTTSIRLCLANLWGIMSSPPSIFLEQHQDYRCSISHPTIPGF